MLKPLPGRTTLPTTSPMSRASVETASKYRRALPPTRPTFFMSSMPAIPVTKVQKMTKVMIMVIKRIKASPSGFMATAQAGLTCPRMMAMATPSSTWKESSM